MREPHVRIGLKKPEQVSGLQLRELNNMIRPIPSQFPSHLPKVSG